ncbi:hypothetical protein GGR56DRAFT_697859 [Xylariaceae sp. FL0804]|nr:hypothetical protein GGR56DRAFT_697859 [Xylariaceae sp. FL0804]
MVEILRAPSMEQYVPTTTDVMELSNQFKNVDITAAADQEQHQQQQQRPAEEAARPVRGDVPRVPRRAFSIATPVSPHAAPQSWQKLLTPTASPREPADVDSYFPLQLVAAVNSSDRSNKNKNSKDTQVDSETAAASAGPSSPGPAATDDESLPPATAVAPLPPAPAQLQRLQLHPQLQLQQRLHRPAGPPPRRSYSVMDEAPVPLTSRPGSRLTLARLPPELHYAVFDFLDPIDSTCLGLTSRHFYAVHRALHGRVPLTARRRGPNDMEWVWRNAGPFVTVTVPVPVPASVSDGPRLRQQKTTTTDGGPEGGEGRSGESGDDKDKDKDDDGNGNGRRQQNSLALLTPRGQVYCRRCRTARCALHKHIRDWTGGLEYCDITERFGRPAPAEAEAVCFRSSPRHPHRCGRHTRNQRTIRLV